jgi:hypothetical protein
VLNVANINRRPLFTCPCWLYEGRSKKAVHFLWLVFLYFILCFPQWELVNYCLYVCMCAHELVVVVSPDLRYGWTGQSWNGTFPMSRCVFSFRWWFIYVFAPQTIWMMTVVAPVRTVSACVDYTYIQPFSDKLFCALWLSGFLGGVCCHVLSVCYISMQANSLLDMGSESLALAWRRTTGTYFCLLVGRIVMEGIDDRNKAERSNRFDDLYLSPTHRIWA